ncbi:MAG TPA: FAD-binding protein, partial [Hyphomicrobiaceae bacterium]|nr:FAD-binding protein [Hyphomicrobiaceae bacterium]
MKAGAVVALDAALPRFADAQQGAVLNDASGLNPTPVFRHWVVQPNEQADFIARLRQELKEATAGRRPVCVGAARHSMGGQSLPRDGLAVTVNSVRCEADRSAKTYLVDAWTRWRQVISALDRIGFSPAVMQSNHDFGVAATFSVNAHGWPVPYGPFGSTVR